MAYKPISGILPQLAQNAAGAAASNFYLKGYESGTNTPLSMGIDATPSGTLAKCKLNSRGEPISNEADENSWFIPHFDQSYKIVLYANANDADNDTLASAVWSVDELSLDFDASTISIVINGLARDSVQSYLENKEVPDYLGLRSLPSDQISSGDTFKVNYRLAEGDDAGGDFVWLDSDLSTSVTNDPQSGVYVAPTFDSSGSSGAFVRRIYSSEMFVNWFGARPEFALASTTLPANDSATAINATYTYVRTNINSANENDLGKVVYSPGGRYLVNSKIDAGLSNSDFRGAELTTDQDIGIIQFYGTRQIIQNGSFYYSAVTSNTAREAIEYGSSSRQFSKNTIINITTRNAYRGAVASTSNLTLFGNTWINCRCDNSYDWAWYLDCKTGSTTLTFINCQARGFLADGGNPKGMYVSATNEIIFAGGFAFDQMSDGKCFQAVNCRVITADYFAFESCEITDATDAWLCNIQGGNVTISKCLVKVAKFAAGAEQDIFEIGSTTTFCRIGDIEVSQTQATDPSDEDVSVTSLTQAAGTATATIGAHSWSNGDTVTISGADQTEYNGDHVISNVTATTFDFSVDSGAVTPATGTILATRIISGTLTYIDGNNSTQIFADNTPLSLVNTGGNNQLFYNRGDYRGYVNSPTGLPSSQEVNYELKNQSSAAGEFGGCVSDGAEYHITYPVYGGERITATTAQFADITDVINTKGKWVGKIVPDTTTNLQMQATGSSAGSAWQPSDGGVVTTPS